MVMEAPAMLMVAPREWRWYMYQVQSQPFAQIQVHRDIGGGTAGEEGVDAFLSAWAQTRGVGVLVDVQVDDQGVHHQRHQEVGTQKHTQQGW